MRRVAPSTIVHEEIGELLAGGTSPETNILSALAQLGVRYVVQQGLEQEQTDHLGRGRYERGAGTKGRRNGYEDATLRTAEGGIGVRVPQVRDAEVPYLLGARTRSRGGFEFRAGPKNRTFASKR